MPVRSLKVNSDAVLARLVALGQHRNHLHVLVEAVQALVASPSPPGDSVSLASAGSSVGQVVRTPPRDRRPSPRARRGRRQRGRGGERPARPSDENGRRTRASLVRLVRRVSRAADGWRATKWSGPTWPAAATMGGSSRRATGLGLASSRSRSWPRRRGIGNRHGRQQPARVGVLRVLEHRRRGPISTIWPRYITATRWRCARRPPCRAR